MEACFLENVMLQRDDMVDGTGKDQFLLPTNLHELNAPVSEMV